MYRLRWCWWWLWQEPFINFTMHHRHSSASNNKDESLWFSRQGKFINKFCNIHPGRRLILRTFCKAREMSSRSKANSLLAPCFAEKKTNHSIGTPEPLTVCLQQTIDLSTLSPKQFVLGTRARTCAPSFKSNKIGIGKKREEREASNCISFSFSFVFFICNGKLTLPKHGRTEDSSCN